MRRTLAVAAAVAFALSPSAFAQGADPLWEEEAVPRDGPVTDIDKLSAEAGIRQLTPTGERMRYGGRVDVPGAERSQTDEPLSGLGAGIADEGMDVQRQMMQPGGGLSGPRFGGGAGFGGTGQGGRLGGAGSAGQSGMGAGTQGLGTGGGMGSGSGAGGAAGGASSGGGSSGGSSGGGGSGG